MAIITQGTTIKKVMSGGTPIKKVMSGGTVIWTSTVMRTITIPVITGVATQTLKIGANQIYSGAGGTTVQVEHGSIITIQATATMGWGAPSVTTPVTANVDFSTASYISATALTNNVIQHQRERRDGVWGWTLKAEHPVTTEITVGVSTINHIHGSNPETNYIVIAVGQTMPASHYWSKEAEVEFVQITSITPSSDSTYAYVF